MSGYDRIAEAIPFILGRVGSQPTLDEIAAHLHLCAFHIQRHFSCWAAASSLGIFREGLYHLSVPKQVSQVEFT